MRNTQPLRTSDKEPNASLDTQDLQSKTYAMRTQNWQQGHCEHCQADFKKKTLGKSFVVRIAGLPLTNCVQVSG